MVIVRVPLSEATADALRRRALAEYREPALEARLLLELALDAGPAGVRRPGHRRPELAAPGRGRRP